MTRSPAAAPLRVTVLHDVPPPYGGVRVSAQQVTQALTERDDVVVRAVPFHGEPSVARLARTWLLGMRDCDVVLFQGGDVLSLLERRGALAVRMAAMARKPLVFRGFAGGLAAAVKALPRGVQATLRRRLRRASVVTVQTRADLAWLHEWIGADGPTLHWWPNIRQPTPAGPSPRARATRFAFVGALQADKGVDTLAAAAALLPAGIEVRAVGHAPADSPWPAMLAERGVHVSGAVPPEAVRQILADSDALVVPTRWPKEGHPGVVLEAFAVGRPVVATRWGGIPDLVDDSCGQLIPPDDPAALAAAMRHWHELPDAWRKAEAGAAARAAAFAPGPWMDTLVEWLVAAVRGT